MLVTAPPRTQFAPRTPTTVTPATPVPALDGPAVDPTVAAAAVIPPPPSLQPEATRGTRMEFGEAASITSVQRSVIDFGLVESLRDRKIYAWLWTNPSNAASYAVVCEIEFWRNYSKIGSLFLSEAVSSVAGDIGQSLVTGFVTGGNVVTDTIAIFPAQPTGTQPNSVKLQPQYIRVAADRVTVSVNTFLNMTGIRLWLGVISSEV